MALQSQTLEHDAMIDRWEPTAPPDAELPATYMGWPACWRGPFADTAGNPYYSAMIGGTWYTARPIVFGYFGLPGKPKAITEWKVEAIL
jgi:hypothetical protein